MQINEHDGVLSIGGDVGINAVESLRHTLRGFIRSSLNPTLDLSEVESCDAAVVQLLIATRKTAANAGKPLAFAGMSPAVIDVSVVLGLPLTDIDPIPV